jgi:tyrosyl-tRNA synthetase
MTLSEELRWRGFVHQSTFKDIEILDTQVRTFYLGVDPSSDSMTIGNLAAVMLVKALIKHGYSAVVLVGGATGMIGDPKDDEERQLKNLDEIAHNKAGIAAQYMRILNGDRFEIVDNYDWFKDMGYLYFLREIGKNFAMSQLLDREFVKERIGENKSGISYAEFSYSLIQGYDFLHLYRTKRVTLQIGGSDQWSNMLSGVPLVRKLENAEVHVLTMPLIVNKATGKKFGKSEDGAVWLDEQKTSVYKFYQFWINVDDEGVEEYLKIYTELPKDEVDETIQTHNADRSQRFAQRKLAYEVTHLIHGELRARSVELLSKTLFGELDYLMLTKEDFERLESELKTVVAPSGSSMAEIMVDAGLASSKGEARRFLQNKAVYINGVQLIDERNTFYESDCIDGYAVVRRGKNVQALVKLA